VTNYRQQSCTCLVYISSCHIYITHYHILHITLTRFIIQKYRAMFPTLAIRNFVAFSASTGKNLKALSNIIESVTLDQPFMGEPLPMTYIDLGMDVY